MSLIPAIEKAKKERVHQIYNTMLDVGIAMYGGGDYRTVIRNARNKAPAGGVVRRTFEALVEADRPALETMVDRLLEV